MERAPKGAQIALGEAIAAVAAHIVERHVVLEVSGDGDGLAT